MSACKRLLDHDDERAAKRSMSVIPSATQEHVHNAQLAHAYAETQRYHDLAQAAIKHSWSLYAKLQAAEDYITHLRNKHPEVFES